MMVLALGNLTSVCLIFFYYFQSAGRRDQRLSVYCLFAKGCQALAYILLLSRGSIPDVISVNMGNTILFIGFYLESIAILTLVQVTGFTEKLLGGITVACAVAFNAIEFTMPDSSLRVAVSSLCVFLILFIPNILLLTSSRSTAFKRSVGMLYLFFVLLMLPRAFYAFIYDTHVLANSPIQALTFLVLTLILIFSLSAYLLLMKESSDKIIEVMATTDFLTGLMNRYSFLKAAERVFARNKRDGKNLAILFVDIDSFKSVNDAHGHAFGDLVLMRLGRIIRDSLRPSDLCCRYGGEEFIILLPDAERKTGLKVADRIRGAIARAEFHEEPEFSFSVCIGVTDGVPEEEESLNLMINRADTALYSAKRNGTNQVLEYDPVTAFIEDL